MRASGHEVGGRRERALPEPLAHERRPRHGGHDATSRTGRAASTTGVASRSGPATASTTVAARSRRAGRSAPRRPVPSAGRRRRSRAPRGGAADETAVVVGTVDQHLERLTDERQPGRGRDRILHLAALAEALAHERVGDRRRPFVAAGRAVLPARRRRSRPSRAGRRRGSRAARRGRLRSRRGTRR